MTSSHIWTLQPSPPPFPGPKFIASSPVCSKCATSRLKITALECGSVSAAEFGGESPSATFPKDPERILSTRWKLLEILLRRPSVQTTCSGKCRCTVVCTLVRLGKAEQRHGRLGTKVAVSQERTFVCSSVESHIQCFSSQVLHTRDQEALGDTAEKGLLQGRPAGKALWLLTWSVTRTAEVGANGLHSHVRNRGIWVCDRGRCR